MRVFGISLWTIAIVLAAMVLGAKRPDLVAKLPLVNRL